MPARASPSGFVVPYNFTILQFHSLVVPWFFMSCMSDIGHL